MSARGVGCAIEKRAGERERERAGAVRRRGSYRLGNNVCHAQEAADLNRDVSGDRSVEGK
jgi:hypothetical protein